MVGDKIFKCYIIFKVKYDSLQKAIDEDFISTLNVSAIPRDIIIKKTR